MSFDLPDDLLRQVQDHASMRQQNLEVAVADLLRTGLHVAANRYDVPTPGAESLRLRREIVEKFISGEWGTELEGFEAGRVAERESSQQDSDRWRV